MPAAPPQPAAPCQPLWHSRLSLQLCPSAHPALPRLAHQAPSPAEGPPPPGSRPGKLLPAFLLLGSLLGSGSRREPRAASCPSSSLLCFSQGSVRVPAGARRALSPRPAVLPSGTLSLPSYEPQTPSPGSAADLPCSASWLEPPVPTAPADSHLCPSPMLNRLLAGWATGPG